MNIQQKVVKFSIYIILAYEVGHKTDRRTMYYCNNCDGLFVIPQIRFFSYEDYGGEWHTCCPICKAPENYTEKEKIDCDNKANETTGGNGAEL